jgi:hypothetical protein
LQPFTAYRTGDTEIDAGEYQRRHPGFAATLAIDAVPLDALVEERTVLKVESKEPLVLTASGTRVNFEEIVWSVRLDNLRKHMAAWPTAIKLDVDGTGVAILRGAPAPTYAHDPRGTAGTAARRRGT